MTFAKHYYRMYEIARMKKAGEVSPEVDAADEAVDAAGAAAAAATGAGAAAAAAVAKMNDAKAAGLGGADKKPACGPGRGRGGHGHGHGPGHHGPHGLRRVDMDIAAAVEAGDLNAEVAARLQKVEHLMRASAFNKRRDEMGEGAGAPGFPGGPGFGPENCCKPAPFGGAGHAPRPEFGMAGAPGHGPGMPSGPMGAYAAERGHMGKGRVLVTLAMQDSKEGMTQKDLAYILGIRPQSLGEMLGKLEAEGLVQRERCEADRRAIMVSLTEAGAEKAAKIQAFRNLSTDSLVGKLTDEEKKTLCQLLAKLTD